MSFQERVDTKFGYGKIEVIGTYISNKKKIKLKCLTCGHEWEARPDNLLHSKVGCPKCAVKRTHDKVKTDTNDFIEWCKSKFGDMFKYDRVDLMNRTKGRKICLICSKCGSEIWTDFQHLKTIKHPERLCKQCCHRDKKKETPLDRFRRLLDEKFPNTYDTSETKWNGRNKPLQIKYNGNVVEVKPRTILNRKNPILVTPLPIIKDKEGFVTRASIIHGGLYDYSEVKYIDSHTDVKIICPNHGEFWQKPYNHIYNRTKCPTCSRESIKAKQRKCLGDFISDCRKVHGDKYDYSKVEYINSTTKVCIICPEHGEFWQMPSMHLSNHGCPICNESRLENTVRVFCEENNINYIRNYQPQWLGKQSIDFFLPDYDIGIECQGKQHFFMGGWSSEENLLLTIDRDIRKNQLCHANNLNLSYLLDEKIDSNTIMTDDRFQGIYELNNVYFNVKDILNNV